MTEIRCRGSLKQIIPAGLTLDDVFFVCIGTDRMTGDALGPLVGTNLTKLGFFNVVGTLDDPCHAVNLGERVSKIPEGKFIIGIDACLGRIINVGNIDIGSGPLQPGVGIGNNSLQPVGDVHITGVVSIGGHPSPLLNFQSLSNARLAIVMKMADQITNFIVEHFGLLSLQQAAAGAEQNIKMEVVN